MKFGCRLFISITEYQVRKLVVYKDYIKIGNFEEISIRSGFKENYSHMYRILSQFVVYNLDCSFEMDARVE